MLFQRIRERIGGVIAAVVGSILACACGAVFTFYLAPQQAIQAGRVSNLPQMDASSIAQAETGDIVLVTGVLADNPSVEETYDYVAYSVEVWTVTLPDPDSEDTTPNGRWDDVETVAPALNLDVSGHPVEVLSAEDVHFGGQLHEVLEMAESGTTADFEGQPLPEGSFRLEGYQNGDLVTVYGSKASTGGVLPEDLFGGDRVAYEDSEAEAAQGLLIAGISMFICAPVVLIGGGLAALFGGRRRRGLRL
jgi:hypothetical protein